MNERFTVVAFHAHPDDEALLTGGTLARAAAEGHRVVLVTATRGERGLAGPADGTGTLLGERRMRELEASARALGCARVVWLGYTDSGLPADPDDETAFANVPLVEAASRLAEVLTDESADVLTTYDANGGYGHPDHVHVHHVGAAAAGIAGTPVVLQATAPGRAFNLVVGLLQLLRSPLGGRPVDTRRVFSSGRTITHRVDVRDHVAAKRAALASHASQSAGGATPRTLTLLLGLPRPVFRWAFGHEWFVEADRPGLRRKHDDVFASLRGQGARSTSAG